MHGLKKQLKLPSSFTGMKKAVSTSNLTDNKFVEGETSPHNLTLDSKHFKSKSPSLNSQDLGELLKSLYNSITERSNENFISDDLPTSLPTEWINAKYSVEVDPRIQKKNSAILELLTTELNYLNQMQFLLDVSAKVFSNVQPRYFVYVDSEDVFLNLGEIYEVNYQFWTTYLFPSFENAKETDRFISSKSWKNGFNQISSIFFPYQSYCSRMTQCQKYIQSLEKDKYFSQFLQWFSHTDLSNRESLSDFIAKPFQRLTKYKLLLTTIRSYSDDQEERDDLAEMITSINVFLKQVEWKLSIAHVSMRIDPMEFVEPPTEDLMELCTPYRQIDLTAPINIADGEIMRQMIKEGTFKMKEAQSKIVEVSLILFTDLILICQKIKNFEVDRIKVIKPIIPLNKLDTISPLPGSLVLRVIDDFGCLLSMYLLTNDHNITNEWIDAIQSSQLLIKNISHPKQNQDCKLFTNLRVNIINPSPLAGRSPTPNGVSIPSSPLSPRNEYFNRTPLNDSFSRTNFGSSPIIRRRLATNSSAKTWTESFHERYSEDYDSMDVNRSLSHPHFQRSDLSIAENDDEQNECSAVSSMSSIDIRTLTESNGEGKFKGKCDIKFRLNGKRSDKLNEMRAYGSMMNLSVDS